MIPVNSTIKTKPNFLEGLKLGSIAFVLQSQNLLLSILHSILYRKQPAPKTILIFRTGSLGDSICSIPTINSIRAQYPDAAIDILTNCGASHLVGLKQLLPLQQFREVIDYSGYGKKALIQLLRSKKYSMVVQLPQVDAGFISLLRDLIVFRFVAAAGWGWVKSQSSLFRRTQARKLIFINETERLLQLASKHGIGTKPFQPFLESNKQDLDTAQQFLREQGIKEDTPLIAMVTGSKRPQNRWPIHYFKTVAEHFSDRYTIVFIGSGEETALLTPLLEIPNTINACGKLSPMGSAALLKQCRLTISNDTGPMHLSYAAGTPTIAIFSSRDLPGKWYPPSHPDHKVFRAEGIPCEGCFSEICSNNICMKAIAPTTVIAAAEELLSIEKPAL